MHTQSGVNSGGGLGVSQLTDRAVSALAANFNPTMLGPGEGVQKNEPPPPRLSVERPRLPTNHDILDTCPVFRYVLIVVVTIR